MFKLDLEKAEEPEIKLPASVDTLKKQENFITSASSPLTMQKPLTVCGSQQTVENSLRWEEYQTTWPASWEICMQVKMQQLEPGMEQQNGSKFGKESVKAVFLSPCLFNLHAEHILWSTGLDKAQAGIKITRSNIDNLRYAADTTVMAESEEELKNLLMKEESEKSGLKLNIQETKIMASGPIISWQIDGETMETVTDFIFLGSKITSDGVCSHEKKRCLLLGRTAMNNLDSILKSKDITLPTKVHLVKTMVFPVVMYGCENWTIKKAEHQRIDAFELWCWRRLFRVPWTARRYNQSVLKEINPDYSLEGLMLTRSSNTLATWCEDLTS